MNAQKGSRLQRKEMSWRRRIAGLVLGASCVLTTAVRAQTLPPENAPVGVETFYGLKKVQAVRPARTIDERVKSVEPSLLPQDAPRVFAGPISPPTIPALSQPQPLTESCLEPGATNIPCAGQPAPVIVRALHETIGPASEEDSRLPPRTEVPELEPLPPHETKPAEVVDVPVSIVTVTPAQPTEPAVSVRTDAGESRSTFITLTSTQTATLAGAFVVSLMAMLLATIYAVRRFGRKDHVRVELILPAGWSSHPAGAGVSPPHRSRHSDTNDSPAKNFELGPTFEEERALRAAEDARRESALLEHICDQNVQLQAEVAGQGTGDGTQADEGR